MTTMKNVVEVPRPLFNKMCEGVQCMNISEGFVNKSFFFQNIEYVVTGFMSSGKEGFISCWGNRIEDLESYKGDLKPMSRNDHQDQVDKGKRPRGYYGQMTKFGQRNVVFAAEQVTFKPVETGIQLELF